MGQIFRTGKSGQLYKANIAGTTPTAQELEQFNKLVAAQGDTLLGSQGPVDTTNPPGTALGRGFSMGIDQTQMMFGRALQSVGENLGFSGLEEYGEEVVAHNEAELGETAQYATRLEDVDGLSSGLSFFGETLGQGIATLLPTAGAALVTRGASVRAGLTPQMLQRTSFSAGAAVNYPILFGENLLEQDQSVEEGILPHVNDGAAALFALPATFLDTLGDRITLGLGGKITKPLLTKKTYQSVTGGAAARFGEGAVKGIMAEAPTEIGQTILTRIQAGKPIDSEDAYREYLEVGIAAGIVGGTIRGTADTLKGDQRKSVAIAQLNQDQAEEAEKAGIGIQQQEEYDKLSNRATNLTEIDDPQIGVLEQEAVPFNEENIPPESRAAVLSGINQEVATNFSPVKLAHLSKAEQKKVRDTRKARGETVIEKDIELPEVQEILGKTAANRIARQQKPLTFRGTIDGTPEIFFDRPDGFRWSQYEKAVRLAISQTRNNKGEAVENANVSIQDIMKVSKTSRAGAVAIRKRMMSDGVIEEYKRNKYVATADAETKAQPIRELEQRVSELQTSIEAADRQIQKEEKKIVKLQEKKPEQYKKAIAEIEDARSRVAESQIELDRLAKIIKTQRTARKSARSKQGPQLNTEAQNRARTKRDEAIKATTKFENARQDVETAVKKRIKEVGIDQDLGAVEIVAKINGPEGTLAQGTYNPSEKVITIATALHGLDADPQEFEAGVMGIANHETLHALYDLGLFTEKEWATLTKAAKSRKFVKVNRDGSTDVREYTFYERAKAMYGDRTDEATVVEEAIAEMFRLYAGGDMKVVGTTKSLFDRIIDFFKAVMNGFEDAGFTSPDEIFESINTGEIASTENRARVAREGAALPSTQEVKDSVNDVALDIVQRALTEEELDEAVTTDIAIQDARTQVSNIKYSFVPVEYYTGPRSEKLQYMQRMSTSEFELADTFKLLFDLSETENKGRTFDSLKQGAADFLTMAQAQTRNPVYSPEYSSKEADGELANLDYLAFLLSASYEQSEGVDPRSVVFSRSAPAFEGQQITGQDLRDIRREVYGITQEQLAKRGKEKNVRSGVTTLYRIGELRGGEALSFTTDPSIFNDAEKVKFLPWLEGRARLLETYLVENENVLVHMDALIRGSNSEHEAVVISDDVRQRDSKSSEAKLQNKKDRIVDAIRASRPIPYDGFGLTSAGMFDPTGVIKYSYLPTVPHLENPQQLGALRRSLNFLFKDGIGNAFWYEQSAKAILKATAYNKAEARKLAGLIAKTSQQTEVDENFMLAVRAYYQHRAGQPMRGIRFASADQLQEILDGAEPRGLKINPFFKNLMKYIDPENFGDTKDVTIDLWMQRAFGYDKTGSPTKAQIAFISGEIQRIADANGMEPEQVQAAIWVAYKSRQEGTEKVGDNYPAQDYADAMKKNLAQISTETIPSFDSGHMNEAFDADPAVLSQFHVDMSKVFLDNEGFDSVAEMFGIVTPDNFVAPGFFEGRTSPGTQTEVAAPSRAKENDKDFALDQRSIDNLNAYAAVMGIVLKQDGVGWHRPFFQTSINKGDRNSVLIDIGRTLTPDEQIVFAEEMQAEFGHGEFGGVASREGLRIIHWPYKYSKEAVDENDNSIVLDLKLKRQENIAFQNGVANAVQRAGDRLGLEEAELTNFYSETGYLFNNWKENLNGENYLQGIEQGRPDLFERASVLIAELQNRAREVEQTYADNYGWTINEQLNDIYRTERKLEEPATKVVEDAEQFLEEMPARDLPDDGDIKHSILKTEFELIPDSEGSPIFGRFFDRDGVAKIIALTNGRHITNGEERGTNHGLAHIKGGGKDAAYAKSSKYVDARDAMSAMMKRLDAQIGRPILIPVLQDGDERRINDIKLKKTNGVIQVTQRVRAESPVYPTESFTTELFWFGNNGMNEGKVMRVIMRRAFINEINAMVRSSPNLTVENPEVLASRINFITTTMPISYNQARNTLAKAIGTQDMIDEAIETGNIENRFKKGDKYSLVPTHPTVAVNPKANTQVDNAKGVYLYGKTSDFMSKVLGVPVKALASTGLLGDVNAKEVTDNLITKLQDAFLPVGQFIDEIRKAGFEVPDAFDTYLMEEQYHNKTGYMLGRAEEILFTPVLNKIKQLPVNPNLLASLERVQGAEGKGFFASMMAIGKNRQLALAETYLFAMHAKERNAYIRQIDPRNDSGSGMTDAEADAILSIINSNPAARIQLQAISSDVQDIVEATRQMNIATGLEPDRQQELTYEGTQTRVAYPQYSNYVPLKGFLEVDPDKTEAEIAEIRRKSANKYGARGAEYIAALGRGSYPDNLVASLFNQHQRAIDRGQRNLVGQSFLKLIDSTDENGVERPQEYRDIVEGVANVGAKRKTKKVLDKNGYVRTISGISRDDPSIMTVKVGGEEVQINVTDPRIAKALKGATGLGPDNSNFLVKAMTTVNRFLSSINTSYNPEFFVTNFLRDISTGLTNINANEIEGITTDVLKSMPSVLKNLRGIIRKGETNELSQTYTEFLEDGGQSALNMIDSLEQQLGKMDEILGASDDPKLVGQFKKGVKRLTDTPLAKMVENYNSVIENAIRVATYQALRNRGFTRERAGQAARNVTVNFSKGGEQKVLMNSLYLFYNASIQGSFALMTAATRSKKVRAIWMSAVVAGFLQDQMLSMMSEEDEDGQKVVDKIPDYVLEHNFVIKLGGLGGREYLSIPLPYGLNFAVNMGRSLSRRGRGGYTNGEFTNSFFGTFVDAVNPIGGTESLANFVAPTVADPFIDIIENEDFSNKPIYKEGSPFGLQKPDSQLYWSTTSPIFKSTAEFLNSATGGSPAKSGLIDWSPDAMEYWYGFLTGGVGRFVERSGRFALNVVDDPASLFSEEGLRQIPFTRKIIGSVSSREDTARFIAGRDQILTVEADLKDAIARGDRGRIQSIRSQYERELSLLGRMKATNNARNRLIRKKAEIAKNPRIPEATKQKMLDKIDEQLQRATQRGNMVVSELYR